MVRLGWRGLGGLVRAARRLGDAALSFRPSINNRQAGGRSRQHPAPFAINQPARQWAELSSVHPLRRGRAINDLSVNGSSGFKRLDHQWVTAQARWSQMSGTTGRKNAVRRCAALCLKRTGPLLLAAGRYRFDQKTMLLFYTIPASAITRNPPITTAQTGGPVEDQSEQHTGHAKDRSRYH